MDRNEAREMRQYRALLEHILQCCREGKAQLGIYTINQIKRALAREEATGPVAERMQEAAEAGLAG